MSQTRLTMRLSAPEAQRIGAIAEVLFEEDGYPISTFEVGNASADLPDAEWTVDIYVADDEADEALARLKDRLGSDGLGAEITAEALGDQDWVAMSLEGLKPVRAGRFFIHGAHDADKIPAGSISVEIEAGQAFGTGHHGTTAGCLLALDRLLRKCHYARIFDLGTGTGLLAIALAKATRTPVLASDIDAISVDVTRENAAANGVGNLLHAVQATGLAHQTITANGPYDLLVANILAGPLMQMASSVCGALAPDGHLVLSGILDTQANRVIAAYTARGLSLENKAFRDGWATLTFRAP